MSSSLDVTKVPILSGQLNYRAWSSEIEAVAMLGGFWGAFSKANDDACASSDAAIKDKGNKREMKAKGLILKTVSHHLRDELKSHNYMDSSASPATKIADPLAQHYWTYLAETYKTKDGVSALLDYQLLLQARFVDDGTLEAQLNKYTELRTNAANSSYSLLDWQFASMMLIALPQSFAHIKDTFLTTADVKTLDPTAVRSRVLETQNRRTNDPTANAISLSTKKPSGGGSGGKKQPKGTRPAKPPPSAKPCWHCNKKGHWANECPDKKTNASNANPSSSTTKDKDKGPNLNVVTSVVATTSSEQSTSDWSAYLYAFGSPESWLFDSGTSDHMTPFGSDFIHGSYHAFMDCTPAVTLGDNATKLSILGRGSIERWVEVAPNQFKSITLSSVLHVRGIQRRFMSPGRLNEKGWTATLPPSERFPVRKGTNACFYGRRIGTLFHVHAYAEPPPGSTTLNVVQALPIKVWHERMGHTHWEALK